MPAARGQFDKLFIRIADGLGTDRREFADDPATRALRAGRTGPATLHGIGGQRRESRHQSRRFRISGPALGVREAGRSRHKDHHDQAAQQAERARPRAMATNGVQQFRLRRVRLRVV